MASKKKTRPRTPNIRDARRIAHLNKPAPSNVPTWGARTIREWLEELRRRGAVLGVDESGKTYAWIGDEGWLIGKIETDYFNAMPEPDDGENAADAYVLRCVNEFYEDDDGENLPLFWSEVEGLVAPEDATVFRAGEWESPPPSGFEWTPWSSAQVDEES